MPLVKACLTSPVESGLIEVTGSSCGSCIAFDNTLYRVSCGTVFNCSDCISAFLGLCIIELLYPWQKYAVAVVIVKDV